MVVKKQVFDQYNFQAFLQLISNVRYVYYVKSYQIMLLLPIVLAIILQHTSYWLRTIQFITNHGTKNAFNLIEELYIYWRRYNSAEKLSQSLIVFYRTFWKPDPI